MSERKLETNTLSKAEVKTKNINVNYVYANTCELNYYSQMEKRGTYFNWKSLFVIDESIILTKLISCYSRQMRVFKSLIFSLKI